MEQGTVTSPTIRPLVAADAARLARCFERCYGNTYVTTTFYDPAAIEARIRAGELRSVVAVDGAGEIVGHMGLTLRHPDALTADAGNTVVDPRFRNQRLAGRLGLGIIDPATDAAVTALRDRGLFFCAILPEYRDGDVLRLQRLPGPRTERALPELVTAPARELLAFIAADRTNGR